MRNIEKYTIDKDARIIDALEKINEFSSGQAMVLFVTNEKLQVIGSLTDGDIRRALLAKITVHDSVQKAMNKNFHCVTNIFDAQKIKRFKEKTLRVIPQVSEDKRFIDVVNLEKTRALLPLSCVIMAGGKGLRLRPYTDDTPKPLLLLEGKPIIVHNIDRLMLYGVKKFYISVNHMKDKIKKYLNSYYKNKDVTIEYIEETESLGTLGAVNLVKNYEHEDILVLNADLLTNIDFEDFYITYSKNKNAMSVATFNVKIDIPYAVLETEDNKIRSLVEKPTYVYYSNAGIYLFKKEFINLVPKNKFYDAIDLIDALIKKKKRVEQYPIRGYWLDIGKPDNYRKAQDDINHIKF